jgi:uncharacterized protein (TIGR03435 family)
MTLGTRLLLLARTAAAAVGMLNAQSSAPRPEFEVASIRPNIEGGPVVFMGQKSPGTFSAQNETLQNLIQEAYGVTSEQRNWLPFPVPFGQAVQILGGPDWMGSDRYDITAKSNAVPVEGQRTMHAMERLQSEMDLMLRTLLEQRFGLKVHWETRDLPVYELTLAKAGKLRQGSCTTFSPDSPLAASGPGRQSPNYCGSSRLRRKGLDWTLDGTAIKMTELAGTLSNLIGNRPIMDKTGYAGTFDVHLQWTPGPGERGAPDVPASSFEQDPYNVPASIFTALWEQLGLKLKAGRGPVEVLIVDHAEKPSAN